MRWFRLAVLILAIGLMTSDANAHLTANSEVSIDFGPHEAIADIIIPQGEYAFATGNPTTNAAPSLERAKTYLTDHVRVTSPDGRAWGIAFERIEFALIAGPPDLHAVIRMIPPPGDKMRRLSIDWRAIIDVVPNHFVLFVAGSDFSAGKLGEGRQVLGALQGNRHRLAIDRGAASNLKGFRSAVALGMRHIAEGHDHLLFLVTLLLPAPLLAIGGAWSGVRPIRPALWQLARIVSAFTIGHSITLIGAALFDWHLPAQPVEICIAISILVSAIHAWRPVFPGHEPIVAAGFGLIHGLAFATVVARFGLGIEEKALSILGFNLGIEVVQLLVIGAVMPSLLMLSRTRLYPVFRSIGAVASGVAAIAWMVERVLDRSNPVAAAVDLALGNAAYIVVAITIGAGAALIAQSRQQAVSRG